MSPLYLDNLLCPLLYFNLCLKNYLKFTNEVRTVDGAFFQYHVGTKAMQDYYKMYFAFTR